MKRIGTWVCMMVLCFGSAGCLSTGMKIHKNAGKGNADQDYLLMVNLHGEIGWKARETANVDEEIVNTTIVSAEVTPELVTAAAGNP